MVSVTVCVLDEIGEAKDVCCVKTLGIRDSGLEVGNGFRDFGGEDGWVSFED